MPTEKETIGNIDTTITLPANHGDTFMTEVRVTTVPNNAAFTVMVTLVDEDGEETDPIAATHNGTYWTANVGAATEPDTTYAIVAIALNYAARVVDIGSHARINCTRVS
jgi:hypothetical protein